MKRHAAETQGGALESPAAKAKAKAAASAKEEEAAEPVIPGDLPWIQDDEEDQEEESEFVEDEEEDDGEGEEEEAQDEPAGDKEEEVKPKLIELGFGILKSLAKAEYNGTQRRHYDCLRRRQQQHR